MPTQSEWVLKADKDPEELTLVMQDQAATMRNLKTAIDRTFGANIVLAAAGAACALQVGTWLVMLVVAVVVLIFLAIAFAKHRSYKAACERFWSMLERDKPRPSGTEGAPLGDTD